MDRTPELSELAELTTSGPPALLKELKETERIGGIEEHAITHREEACLRLSPRSILLGVILFSAEHRLSSALDSTTTRFIDNDRFIDHL